MDRQYGRSLTNILLRRVDLAWLSVSHLFLVYSVRSNPRRPYRPSEVDFLTTLCHVAIVNGSFGISYTEHSPCIIQFGRHPLSYAGV